MDYTRPKADAVIVGLGWAGSLMAEELTRAGLNVVAIERGPWETTAANFPPGIAADELRYGVRREITKPPRVETLTFRNTPGQTALPGRDWNIWQMGYSVGGAGKHWAANSWRFNPSDFEMATRKRERYADMELAEGLIVQDWGISYDELEPFYDRFEKIGGISGQAGNLQGQIMPGGNPFEGARSDAYPTPPLVRSHWNDLFAKTTTAMGYHPFPIPAGTIGAAYRNALGIELAPCTYCGFYGCGNFSKSSPNICVIPALMDRPNFTLLTECTVMTVDKARDGKTVTGVTFKDSDGNIGQQPADIVCVSAYQLDNVRLLALSQIGTQYDPTTGEGTLGRAYNYQTMSYGFMYFDDEYMNPFISTGALSTQIDDFNGDNFDHSGLGFLGGAGIQALSDQGTPIGMADRVPPGTKKWGSEWKAAFQKSYQNYAKIQGQGTSYSHRDSYLSLDPTYKDANGQPLLRMTFDYNENDRKMSSFIRGKIEEICKATGASSYETISFPDRPNSPFTGYDSSHTIGGAVMGLDPATSVLNRYQQHWDAHNLFVLGASSYPNNGGYNPTETLSALTLWTARHIINDYLKAPGSMVR
ncbi:GMC family oxidoreductase [Thioclava sp. GXIMD4215]|uniref:GMC family oxidoreductase n=1 Tax=Thioclava sp. GXIMD4215 TaxID=3131928 RepID=UPI00311B105F